jgi:phenylpyruvate tautomerase PptA (4-oxalocrotonate tautomerase family)
MPKIQLTVPAGALTAEAHRDLQKSLAATLMRWEGVPDTPFFRASAWSYVIELPEGAQATVEDHEPRFLVEATVPQGALSQGHKEGLVREVTKLVLEAAGLAESDGLRVWVLIHEQAEGSWGIGGGIIQLEALRQIAQQQREGVAQGRPVSAQGNLSASICSPAPHVR